MKLSVNDLFAILMFFFFAFVFSDCTNSKNQTTKKASSQEQKCQQPPTGMRCIPAGPTIIGSTRKQAQQAIDQTKQEIKDRKKKLQRKGLSRSQIADLKEEIAFMNRQIAMIWSEIPQQQVYISTFYIDKYEITNEDFRKCVDAGACRQYRKIHKKLYSRSLADKQPAVPLSWKMAHDYCKWRGKRLPTEAEWEKVARGGLKATLYPWGNSTPDCKKANFKYCTDDITRAVGSYPAGHYGVFDMAGNGYEWVNDWASDCRGINCKNSCGRDCLGKDPKGPCGGKYPCKQRKTKVLKGGSWWWSSVHLRGASRRLEYMHSGPHRLSARCASDSPILTDAPAWMLRNPPSEPPDPIRISQKQQDILHNLEGYDTLNKPLCKYKFKSPAHCKDPKSYVIPNETRNWLFKNYVKNLGGGYVGVASDANYSYIAHARSQWVWLYDFDIKIVNYHRLLKPLILASTTPDELMKHFSPYREQKTLNKIIHYYKNHPQLDIMKQVFAEYREDIYKHLYIIQRPRTHYENLGWMRSQKAYHHIHLLHKYNRISISPGDMLKDKTIRAIGKSARELGVIVRIYYPSNAEEFWQYSEIHKKNILSLPFDNKSIIVSTLEPTIHPSYRWQPWSGYGRFWHYIIRGALNHQKKLTNPYYQSIDDFWQHRIQPTEHMDFSTILLPGNIK